MKKGKSSSSWKEKMQKPAQPKIVQIPARWLRRMGPGKMLVPSPQLVDQTIRKIRKGKLATVNDIRNKLANDYGVDTTCPLTTGIFLNVAANAAEEAKAAGRKNITPYWRVLKKDGYLNPKFPRGQRVHAAYLRQEGFKVKKKRGSGQLFVAGFEKKLTTFS